MGARVAIGGAWEIYRTWWTLFAHTPKLQRCILHPNTNCMGIGGQTKCWQTWFVLLIGHRMGKHLGCKGCNARGLGDLANVVDTNAVFAKLQKLSKSKIPKAKIGVKLAKQCWECYSFCTMLSCGQFGPKCKRPNPPIKNPDIPVQHFFGRRSGRRGPKIHHDRLQSGQNPTILYAPKLGQPGFCHFCLLMCKLARILLCWPVEPCNLMDMARQQLASKCDDILFADAAAAKRAKKSEKSGFRMLFWPTTN